MSSSTSIKPGDEVPVPELIDYKRILKKRPGIYYDAYAAEKPIRFAKRFLKHIKGEWGGTAVILDPWECDILRTIFGFFNEDGTRLIRTLYLEIPRKNGKSLLGTVIALYMLFCDKEPGAEVYSAANDKKQAAIIFNQAKAMIAKSPALKKRSRTYKESIVKGDSSYQVLSADAFTKDGLSCSCLIYDELHGAKTPELYDVLRTSMGARRQPLEVYLTTAGTSLETICGDVHDYAIQVKKGIIDDPTFLGVIYAAEPDDDPADPRVWARCNPGFGVTVKIDYLEKMYRNYLATNRLAVFKRYHLNVWTNTKNSWLKHEHWRRVARRYKLDKFKGQICYAAVDLSKVDDLTAVSLAFPNEDYSEIYTWTQVFCPRETAEYKEKEDRVPYLSWAKKGWITLTDGEIIDYEAVADWIQWAMDEFDLREVAFDEWGSTQMQTQLTKIGAPTISIRQSYKAMSPAMLDTSAYVIGQKLFHPNSPVVNWCVDNVIAKENAGGQIMPDKGYASRKRNSRIDAAVALIMSVARALHYHEEESSIYDEQGIEVIS